MKKLLAAIICAALICCAIFVCVSAKDVDPINAADGLSLSEAIEAIEASDEPRNAPPTSDTVLIAVSTLAAAAIAAIIISKKH